MSAAEETIATHVAKTEIERIDALRGELRAGRLALAGPRDVLRALENGQVEEILISPALAGAGGNGSGMSPVDDLVHRALATSARVRFVEEPGLLAELGGVVASLRYKPGVSPRDTSPVAREVEV